MERDWKEKLLKKIIEEEESVYMLSPSAYEQADGCDVFYEFYEDAEHSYVMGYEDGDLIQVEFREGFGDRVLFEKKDEDNQCSHSYDDITHIFIKMPGALLYPLLLK